MSDEQKCTNLFSGDCMNHPWYNTFMNCCSNCWKKYFYKSKSND